MNIKTIINHPELFSFLIALILSTLLIGYAPSSIAFGIFLFFVIRHIIINKPKLRLEPMLILLIVLYTLFGLSYFWTVDQDRTIKGLGRLIPLLLIPISFSVIPKFTLKNYNLILNYFTISNVFLGIFFLVTASLNYFKNNSLNAFTYHELVKVLNLNAIYVSIFFSISYFYLLTKQHKLKIEKAGIFFLGTIILLLSSKAMIFIFVLCNIVYLTLYKGKSYLKSTKAILSLLIAIIVFTIGSHKVVERFLIETTTDFKEVINREKFNKVYPWTGSSIRILQLRILKDQIEDEDIFWKGFGLYASRNNLKARHIGYNTYRGYHSYNYHNMYAQILSELGIFGLICLLLILILNIRKAIQSKVLLYLIFNIILFIVFFTESFLWVHRGIFLFTILYCLFNWTNYKNINSKIN